MSSVVLEKKSFTLDDRRRITIAHLSLRLRSAENYEKSHLFFTVQQHIAKSLISVA